MLYNSKQITWKQFRLYFRRQLLQKQCIKMESAHQWRTQIFSRGGLHSELTQWTQYSCLPIVAWLPTQGGVRIPNPPFGYAIAAHTHSLRKLLIVISSLSAHEPPLTWAPLSPSPQRGFRTFATTQRSGLLFFLEPVSAPRDGIRTVFGKEDFARGVKRRMVKYAMHSGCRKRHLAEDAFWITVSLKIYYVMEKRECNI